VIRPVRDTPSVVKQHTYDGTYHSKARTPTQAAADRRSDEIAKRLGSSLHDARKRRHLTQAEVSDKAGIARTTYAAIEARPGRGVTLTALNRAAAAVGCELVVYVSQASAADEPRDSVHLRNQELVAATAVPGGWRSLPEERLDSEPRTSRAADVLLNRGQEWAIHEIYDWFADVGAAFREWDRRLAAVERYAIAQMVPPSDRDDEGDPVLPRVSGCWVVRSTIRNRALVSDHRHLFQARFPASPVEWLRALRTAAPMPLRPALIWVSVDGKRLFPSRLKQVAQSGVPTL
jgi:transcriptional regulator with XRE-family HTH domain